MSKSFVSNTVVVTFTNQTNPDDRYTSRMVNVIEKPEMAKLVTIVKKLQPVLTADGSLVPTKLQLQTKSVVAADAAPVAK